MVEAPTPTVGGSTARAAWSGWVGAGVVVAAAGWLSWRGPRGAAAPQALAVLWLVLGAMALTEVLAGRVHLRHFDFTQPRPLDRARTLRRFVGLGATVLAALVFYSVAGVYEFDPLRGSSTNAAYQTFFSLYRQGVLATLALGPLYIVFAQRYGTWADDDDELQVLGTGWLALLRGQRPAVHFGDKLRSVAVKVFFVPLMLGFYVGNLRNFVDTIGPLTSMTPSVSAAWAFQLHRTLLNALLTVDVALCCVGYAVSLRLFDNHVRSAEPTWLGWGAALLCYPPFNTVLSTYTGEGLDEEAWKRVLGEANPAIVTAMAVVSLASMAVYTWATVAFGLRFSNLTHRGVIAHGPYAWVRHPAYVTKNLAWWILSVPFLRGPVEVLQLVAITALYALRAWTEERHLLVDPEYQTYTTRVRWRFLPGVW